MHWLDKLIHFWPHLAAALHLLSALLTSFHALLHKRDSRAAALWLGVIWFLPVLGPILYLTFGFNRIRRRAISLGVQRSFGQVTPERLKEGHHPGAEHLEKLAEVVGRVVALPLSCGNDIQPLLNGDEAFPAMLAAIASAKVSITLSTYIFDNDPTGAEFVDALSRAIQRGVEVRVLIDAAGARYSFPSIAHRLKRANVPFATFLPSSLLAPWRVATINLRNHRKILVVDGAIGFTGGINLRHGNVLANRPKDGIQDLHFRVTGPVVRRLQEAFVNDWAFTTGETFADERWFPDMSPCGNVVARVITDGPDADYDKLRWTLLAALTEARKSVQILTPYFLPDRTLITAMNLAVMRGVRVDVYLPAKNNLPVVHWASRALWWQILERGCRIWLTPPPFDHTKLMVVDGCWVLLGTANWDERSLRLNFELNIECYGRAFAEQMTQVIERKVRDAREVTLAEADGRSYPGRVRDAVARLFSPYL